MSTRCWLCLRAVHTGDWPSQTPESPFKATSAEGSPFDALPSLLPTRPPATIALSSQHHSSSQSGLDHTFDPSMSLGSDRQPPPHMGSQYDTAPLSHGPSTDLSIGSRAPSVPIAQASSSHRMASSLPSQNMSNSSLASLASGSGALPLARSPSPQLGYDTTHTRNDAQGEAAELRQQLRQKEIWHAEELTKLNAEHEVRVTAMQAQAVAKMKELIEKVSCYQLCLCDFAAGKTAV